MLNVFCAAPFFFAVFQTPPKETAALMFISILPKALAHHCLIKHQINYSSLFSFTLCAHRLPTDQ